MAIIKLETLSAPDAVDDSFSVADGETLTVDAPGVLANDTDADGEDLTVNLLVDDVDNGDLSIFTTGRFIYTPDPGFVGLDSFTYQITDGTETDQATVTIDVQNAAPDAVDDSFSVADGETLTVDAPGVLANDTDADGEDLTVNLLVDDVDNGDLSIFTTGRFIYTPDPGFVGLDSFTYQITDGTETDQATVTIDVQNAAPDAVDDSFSVADGETLTVDAPGVLANDTDADGEDLTVNLLVDDVDNGDLSIFTTGRFIYTPDPGFVGLDSFTYQITDGTETDQATVTIDVQNAAPDAVDDSFSVADGETLTVDAPGVLANDTDADGEDLTVNLLVDDVDNGDLSIFTTGRFIYTPDPGFVGLDSFTYQITDGTETDQATVTIDVQNAAPDAVDDSFSVADGETLTVDAPGVLANDTDADGEDLTVNLLVDDVDNGDLSIFTTGRFIYTPDPGFVGLDSFTYQITDGTETDQATVTIDVQNAAPDAVDDSFSVADGETLTVDAPGVLANDTDADGEDLTVNLLVDDVDNGDLSIFTTGRFIYTPDPGFVGLDSFTYQITDGTETDQATVTIDVQNAAPDAVDDSFSVADGETLTVDAPGVLANDTDADGEDLTVNLLVDDVDNGDLSIFTTGRFIYTPDPGFVGLDSFTYQITDGTETDQATVTIDVQNAAPDAVDDSFSVADGETLTVDAPGVLANDTDADGEDLTVNLLVDDVDNGDLSIFTTGRFIYTPDPGFVGLDSFTYQITDGTETDQATVTIDVQNAAPDAVDDSFSVVAGGILSVPAPGVLGNDSDTDGDALTAGLVCDVSNGTLSLTSDGSFDYVPDIGFAGADEFVYAASDGAEQTNATAQIEVDRIDIVGTDNKDRLFGSEHAELFRPLGGNADQTYLGGGMDVVAFGAETSNEKKEITQIFGFSSDDALDLGGATVESFRDNGRFVDLTLSGDGDRVLVFDADFFELNFA